MNSCGGKSDNGSCYCDSACAKFADCCADYEQQCKADRTVVTGACVKNSGDSCTTDADCNIGGCGAALCYNPAVSSGISSCECTGPGEVVSGCGCVQGKCNWYTST